MWAADARQEAEWDRTASQLALAANLKAGRVVASPKNLNPYKQTPSTVRPLTLGDMVDFLEPE